MRTEGEDEQNKCEVGGEARTKENAPLARRATERKRGHSPFGYHGTAVLKMLPPFGAPSVIASLTTSQA
jgi:hypothetical protein